MARSEWERMFGRELCAVGYQECYKKLYLYIL